MAIATQKQVLFTPPPPPPVSKTRVVLELSTNEAETLLLVLGRVGGDPRGSRRGYTDSIYKALGALGFSTAKIVGAGSPYAEYADLLYAVLPSDGRIVFKAERLDPFKD